jgi:SAM-dependent methyltransferase
VLASESKSKKLKYGFELMPRLVIPLKLKMVNQQYESLVWGTQDDADHTGLAKDEQKILKQILKMKTQNTLEVGPGSGRVTRYILKRTDFCSIIEREPAVMKKLKEKIDPHNKMFQQTVVGDFSKKLDRRLLGKFDRVILIENMLGMNPCLKDRLNIFKNAARVLKPDGMALFGFRVRADITSGYRVQIMPYEYRDGGARKQWFGCALNWSVSGFLSDLKKSKAPLSCEKVVAGQSRPAGGRMYFAVLALTR